MSLLSPSEQRLHEQAARLATQSKFLFNAFQFPEAPQSAAGAGNYDDLSSWPSSPFPLIRSWYAAAEANYASFPPTPTPSVNWPNTMAIATCEGAFPSVRTVLLKGLDADGLIFFTNYSGAKGRAIAANPNVALGFYWKGMERQLRVEGRAEKLTDDENNAYFHSRPFGSQLSAMASPQSAAIASHSQLEGHYIGHIKEAAKFLLRRAHGSGKMAEQKKAEELIEQYLPEFKSEILSSASSASPSEPLTLPPLETAHSGPVDSEVHGLHSRCLEVLARFESDPALQSLTFGLIGRPAHWGGYRVRPAKVEFWEDGKYRLHSRLVYEKKGQQWEKSFRAP